MDSSYLYGTGFPSLTAGRILGNDWIIRIASLFNREWAFCNNLIFFVSPSSVIVNLHVTVPPVSSFNREGG